eukprot:gene16178-biopygen8216
MRIAACHIRSQPDPFQKIGNTLFCLGARSQLVFEIGFGNRSADGDARVETGERILKDHLHGAAHIAQPLRLHGQHVFPVQQHLAAERLHQTHDGASGRRLAATGFTDERQGLARLQGEGQILHRMHAAFQLSEHPRVNIEAGGEVLHLEQWLYLRFDGVGGLDRHIRRAGCPVHHRKAQRTLVSLHRAENGNSGKKRAGIGMLRTGKNVLGPAGFHRLAIIHDDGAVSDLGDDAHIVGDEEDGRALLFLQQLDQIENLALDRHV